MPNTSIKKVINTIYLFAILTLPTFSKEQALPKDLESTVQAAHDLIVFDQPFLENFLEKVDQKKLAKATSLNDARAQLITARLNEQGVLVEQDLEKAFKLYQTSSEQGQHLATIRLAILYFKGKGVERDEQKGIGLLKEVAAKKHPWAYVKPSEIYRKGGPETSTNHEEARRWGDLALGSNDQRCIGRIKKFRGADITFGRFRIKADPKKGTTLLKEAAKLGDDEAMSSLGIVHYYGRGFPKDFQKSFKFFEQSAKKGNAYGMTMLGFHFRNGLGTKRDLDQTLYWFEKSAKYGDRESGSYIGEMYLNGEAKNIGPEKALASIRDSAERKGLHGIYLLAKVHEEGLCGVEKNPEKAVTLYTQIAHFESKKGGYTAYPPAVKKLSWLHQGNNGVPLDAEKAIRWLNFLGDDKDHFQIGQLYDYGKGIKQNHKLAFEHYLKSAKLGNRNAAHKVSQFYEKGIGVEKDPENAAHWKSK